LSVWLFGCAAKQDGYYDEESFHATRTYYEYLNESSITAYLDVGNDGKERITYVTLRVKFFDAANLLLATKEYKAPAFIDKGGLDRVSAYFFNIDGKADYYELAEVYYTYEDYSLSPWIWTQIVLLGLFLVWLVAASICNKKVRHYKHDEHKIEVYAGWTNHYIKIDGTMADRIKTAFSFGVKLEAQKDDIHVQVHIGNGFLGNTISTKINGVVVFDVLGR
jgi:hypothetical protein